MRTRILNLATILSTAIFGLMLIAWPVAGLVQSQEHLLHLPGGFGLRLWGGLDGSVEVINYAGDKSFFFMATAPLDVVVPIPPNPPKDIDFHHPRSLGVCFEVSHYYWPRKATLWCLFISLAYPLIVSALFPGYWIIRRFGQIRKSRQRGFPVLTRVP